MDRIQRQGPAIRSDRNEEDAHDDGVLGWLMASVAAAATSLSAPADNAAGNTSSAKAKAGVEAIAGTLGNIPHAGSLAQSISQTSLVTEECSSIGDADVVSERTSLLGRIDPNASKGVAEKRPQYGGTSGSRNEGRDEDSITTIATSEYTSNAEQHSTTPILACGSADLYSPEQTSLDQLEVELSRIVDKPAFDQALSVAYSNIKNPIYRHSFICATESRNPKAAAQRMVAYYQLKRDLFGPTAIGKRCIELCDLSWQDLAELSTGHIQILSCGKTIPAGCNETKRTTRQMRRPVVLCCLTRHRPLDMIHSETVAYPSAFDDNGPSESFPVDSNDVNSIIRNLWYTCSAANESCASERTSDSKPGEVLVVVYGMGLKFQFGGVQLELLRKLVQTSQVMPFTLKMMFCFQDAKLQSVVEMIKAGWAHSQNLRVFAGSHTECQYTLLTCGIPPHCIPLTESGKLDRSNHLKWLRTRKQQENRSQETTSQLYNNVTTT